MIASARDRKIDKILKTAKYLFRRTAEELQLYSKDIEILSSSQSVCWLTTVCSVPAFTREHRSAVGGLT